jgi:hypothetical protein
VIEIGWTFLARRYWGGRYNGEMKRLMLEHAFQTVDEVVFIIGPENHRSRRAVEKIGAIYRGVTPDAKGRERVVYGLTKGGFAERETRTSSELIVSYLTLRRVIGILGVALPFVLAIWGWFIQHGLLPTISDYYGLRTRDAFVGFLFAIGWFLYTYHGYTTEDNYVSNAAGVLALGVAVFPTGGTKVEHSLHLACAAGLFCLLAYFSYFLFTKSGPTPTLQKLKRNRIYRGCGIAMVICIGLIAFYNAAGLERTRLAQWKPVFFLEAMSLWAFGFSWLVKGETLWRDPQ